MQDWVSAEQLSALIGGIYDSAIDPARWSDALEAIRSELKCQNAILSLHALPAFTTLLHIPVNVPEIYLGLVDAAGPDVAEQWGGVEKIAAHPITEPAVMTWVNGDTARMRATRYFRDFAVPQGLHDVLAVMLARDAEAVGALAFGRAEAEGPIGEREVAVARLLVPHLQRAATINRLLDLSALAKASFGLVVDRLVAPVILVDAQARILHVNPSAATVLAQGDPLTGATGLLNARQPGVDHALAVAIAAAAGDVTALGRKGLEIPARDAEGGAFVLHILPLTSDVARRLGAARVAVFVGRARTGLIPSGDLLASLFALTPTEARVFQALAAGHDMKAIASLFGVAPSTIKTHLGRLYQKTGARRQAELVQIAASLAPPLLQGTDGVFQ